MDWVPVLVFGGFAMVAGCLTLLLPETGNLALPDTFEEAEALGKKKSGKSFEKYTNAEMGTAETGLREQKYNAGFAVDEAEYKTRL